ncbi:MAG: outer membrane lipoprotein chaperone LolA [Pseudomonadota bacterium]
MKQFKRALSVMVFPCALGVSMAVFADKATVERSAKVVSKTMSASESLAFHLKPVTSFTANFHQKVIDEDKQVVETLSGEMSVKQPGKLHWTTNKPFSQTLVTDGKQLWFYDEDLKQVTVKKVVSSLMQSPALILSGDIKSLNKNFKVKEVAQKSSGKNFSLTPLKDNSMFETLNLILKDGKVSQLIIRDALQQKTIITLSNVKQNVKLNNTLFSFKAPKGVKVVKQD